MATAPTYTPVRRDGRGGYQVDGYAIEQETGELYVAVSDFRGAVELETLNVTDVESAFNRARNFLELSIKPDFINGLEETSPTFEAAYPILSRRQSIQRIRLVIFSNAQLAVRRPPETKPSVIGCPVVFDILDFARFVGMRTARGRSEPIRINIKELNGSPLPCLEAHGGEGEYSAYLVALPGPLLARIYGLYGARLLEQNVRTFLQAKTKVNRGIINTIKTAPEMFFAYNNGLTATASHLDMEQSDGLARGITSIQNLQIVNGGQTTASVLYAHDKNDADLSRVWIPMKLSVVSPERMEEIVPQISRFANTQNKISEADFFSSHPFHLTLEKMSRRMMAPTKSGYLSGSRWFYERARGQYKDQLAYCTSATRKKFEREFPKEQVIDKTDLAKYELTFGCRPHVVSLGAQKCFIEFAEQIGEAWDQSEESFTDAWFKRAVAKAVIFRFTDRMVGTSKWYQTHRGYKAQIVTYSIAWLVSHLQRSLRREIALEPIWVSQAVPETIGNALEQIARQVARKINDTPDNVRNVGEYCKQLSCWHSVAKAEFKYDAINNGDLLKSDRSESIYRETDIDDRLRDLVGSTEKIYEIARSRNLLSPKSDAALTKLSANDVALSKSEKNALKHLLDGIERAGRGGSS